MPGLPFGDQRGEEPTAYLRITMPEFPNPSCMCGPGTNLAHGGSVTFPSECQITYVMGCLHELPRRRRNTEIHQMVWGHWSIEHSHFTNPEGASTRCRRGPCTPTSSGSGQPDRDDYVFT